MNTTSTLSRPRRVFLALAFATTALAACGGGGGDATPSPSPAPAPAPAPPAGASLILLAGQAGGLGNLDGQGSDARFFGVADAVATADGTVLVADTYNHAIRSVSAGGKVTTLAGRADGASAGHADGTGSEAAFDEPLGIARAADGSFFVSDYNNKTLRRIDGAGRVSTVAGASYVEGAADGDGATARLGGPYKLSLGLGGDLYFIDFRLSSGTSALRRLSPAGSVKTLAGTHAAPHGSTDGPGATARFLSLTALAVDPQETALYLADTDGISDQSVLRRVELDFSNYTVSTMLVLDPVGDPLRFGHIRDLKFDTNGELLVLADGGQRIVRVDLATNAGRVWAGTLNATNFGSLVDGPLASATFRAYSLSVDPAGTLWVVDGNGMVLRKIGTDGLVRSVAGQAVDHARPRDGVGTGATFQAPRGMVADSTGALWVADRSTLRRIGNDGAVSTLAGQVDVNGLPGFAEGSATDARFGSAVDVALDSAGNAYIVDVTNCAIRKLGRDGRVSSLAGGSGTVGSSDGVGAQAHFNYPRGVALDPLGTVYVADTNNHTIRKITPTGEVLTLAGKAGVGGDADSLDGRGDSARFVYPEGLAADAQGTVYVADTGNHTIRKITAAGVVTTFAGSPGNPGAADGTGPTARFTSPAKLLLDAQGNLLVVDGGLSFGSNGNLVRKITPAGVVTTVLGQPGRRGTIAGALPGALGSVSGLALLPNGQLAVSTDNAVFVTRGASF